jgi:hypothetical protein
MSSIGLFDSLGWAASTSGSTGVSAGGAGGGAGGLTAIGGKNTPPLSLPPPHAASRAAPAIRLNTSLGFCILYLLLL